MTDTLDCFAVLDLLISECNKTAKDKGFWDAKHYTRDGPEKIALMHTELSEALEEMRNRNFGGVTEELADVVIRIFDYAGEGRLQLAEAILSKMERNKDRPRLHGKAF